MKKEFIVNRQGKDFVLYAGLLDQAHREGLKRISTKLLQAPDDTNSQVAICWAEVETEKGIFSGIGDAGPHNVGRMIAPHTIRMAETRAKARALRDAINVGVTAFEELGDVDDDTAPLQRPALVEGSASSAPKEPTPIRQPAAATKPAQQQQPAPASDEQRAQLKRLRSLAGIETPIADDLSAPAAATEIRTLASRPSREGHFSMLVSAAQTLQDEFGVSRAADFPEDTATIGEIDDLLQSFRTDYAARKAAAASAPAPATPAAPAGPVASKVQIDRITKLSAALGRPPQIAVGLTSEAAAAQISTLVHEFNAQAKGGRVHA